MAAAAATAGISPLQSALVSLDRQRVRVDSGPTVVSQLGIGRTGSRGAVSGGVCVFAKVRKPVEERFKIQHEKNVTPERLKELGMDRWSKWECGPNVTYRHEWQVDEQIYISKGSVMVTPEDCEDSAYFYQGDIV